MIKRGKKKASLLVENVIFIILNLVFLTILILFIVRQGSGEIVLEQSYAKNIALLIDSAKPVTTIKLDMYSGKKLAEKNGIPFNEVVRINENFVKVKLSEDSEYSYAFFNDVDVSVYPDEDYYIIKVNRYKNV